MEALGLNILELLEVVRVCRSLCVEKCPAFELRDFIAGGLAGHLPELAARVRRLEESQLDTLGEYVQGVRSLLRPGPSKPASRPRAVFAAASDS
jgi:hypothetical protein